jgi:hypothetical protein
MNRSLSPDELNLEPEVLSDEDFATWIASIESRPDVIQEEIDQLTVAPRRALATMHQRAYVATGRAVSKAVMAKLEQRGLVKAHGKVYQLTNFGRNIGRYLAQKGAS